MEQKASAFSRFPGWIYSFARRKQQVFAAVLNNYPYSSIRFIILAGFPAINT